MAKQERLDGVVQNIGQRCRRANSPVSAIGQERSFESNSYSAGLRCQIFKKSMESSAVDDAKSGTICNHERALSRPPGTATKNSVPKSSTISPEGGSALGPRGVQIGLPEPWLVRNSVAVDRVSLHRFSKGTVALTNHVRFGSKADIISPAAGRPGRASAIG
jgi:hypothetical protein